MTDLPARMRAVGRLPLPEGRRLWLAGTGPAHDAAELAAFAFAGSGRSVVAAAGEGHDRLAALLGPQDAVVWLGGDPVLRDAVARTASGVGVALTDVAAPSADDPTEAFVLLAHGLLAAAPGAEPTAAEARVQSVEAALGGPAVVDPDWLRRTLVVAGTGPAAVTARHAAVALRRAHGTAVEGMDATEVVRRARAHLGAGGAFLLLDPVGTNLPAMLRAEGCPVVEVAGPDGLPAPDRQLPLAVGLARAVRA